VLVSGSPTLVDSVRRRRRAAHLASTDRAGVHSRRLIRQRQHRIIRDRWYVFAGIVAVGAVVCLAVKLFVWEPVDAYLIGAIGASTLWAWHSILTSVDGLSGKRVGVLAEEWTISELQKLRKQGWRFVNHVMLEYVDVDHAVLGPAGFFAVDSKYRSNWSMAQRDLEGLAAAAREQARNLQSRLHVKTPKVQPVVVMWGPDVADTYDGPLERDGVLFCPGSKLVEHLRALPTATDSETIESAYSTLDRYVEQRDIGERRKLGEPVRSVGDHFNDFVFAGIAMGKSLFFVALPARIPPAGFWSVMMAALISAASVLTRRRLDSNPMRKGTVSRNVADLSDPPKVRVGGSREMTIWSADELREFLAGIEGNEWYVPIYLAANTGMRRGEVLGVPWRNVDLDAARLVVDQQILAVEYGTSVADVKTTNSRRTIDLDARTVGVLRTWRRQQLEQRMSTGRHDEDSFVFTRPDGEPIHPDFFSQSWQRLVRESGLRRIRLHDLRHTHASILLKANVPVKVVSERLGHGSPRKRVRSHQQSHSAEPLRRGRVSGPRPASRPPGTGHHRQGLQATTWDRS